MYGRRHTRLVRTICIYGYDVLNARCTYVLACGRVRIHINFYRECLGSYEARTYYTTIYNLAVISSQVFCAVYHVLALFTSSIGGAIYDVLHARILLVLA